MTRDRSKWSLGPWDSEPEDKVQWEDVSGLTCLAVRNSLGAWCGYVGVPPGHRFFGKDYDSLDNINVHGGLTYAAICHGEICRVPPEGQPDAVWWFGFDTCHDGDRFPCCNISGTYRTIDYIKQECSKLAAQLRDST